MFKRSKEQGTTSQVVPFFMPGALRSSNPLSLFKIGSGSPMDVVREGRLPKWVGVDQPRPAEQRRAVSAMEGRSCRTCASVPSSSEASSP